MPSSIEKCRLCPFANILPAEDVEVVEQEQAIVEQALIVLSHPEWGPPPQLSRGRNISAAQELAARGCVRLIAARECEKFVHHPVIGLREKK